MGHLFISYSRRDGAIVRRLNDALKARGRDVWVDWEGIRPGAEWLREIYAAIDAADAFVFVISPDSAASRECRRELDHALLRHKRLVPVVCRDASPDALGEAISAHNWIFLREGDDFEKGLDAVIAAADTDLKWVHAHTRLLTRALEWDAHRRDHSFALVGTDLRASERLLTEAGEKQPRLTDLHVEYVLASRRAATRRALLTRGAATVASCVLLVVLLAAWGVERQARLFLARDLHARAASALADRDVLSAQVLLAESLTLEDRPETRERFLEARLSGATLAWSGPTPPQKTQQQQKQKQAAEEQEEGGGGGSRRRIAAISPDGTRFVVADGEGAAAALRVWDAAGRRERFRLPMPGGVGGPLQVRFSPDGNRLAAVGGHRDGGLRVWDAATGEPLGTLPAGRGGADIEGLAFSPDGRTLATAGSDRTVRLWDVASRAVRRTISGFAEQITSLAFSPDGATLACGGWDQDVTLWSVASGRRLHLLRGHEDEVTSLAFSPDGALLASAGWDGRIWLWDARDGQRLRPLLGHRSGVVAVSFAPDGSRVVSGSAGGVARLWDAETGQNLLALRGHGARLDAVAFSSGGRGLVTGDRDGGLRVWDVAGADAGATGEQRALRGHAGPTTTVGFLPDGQLLASGSHDRTVRLWDAETGRAVRVLRGHSGGVFSLAFSPDGKLLASGGRGATARLWDAQTGRQMRVLPQGGAARDVTFRPDGRVLATAGDDSAVRFWDPVTGAPLRRLSRDVPVLSVSFSPDGDRLAAGKQDGDVEIWDVRGVAPAGGGGGVEGGQEPTLLATLRGHTGAVWAAYFSPDGRWIGTAGEDGAVRLWDAAALSGGGGATSPTPKTLLRAAHGGAVWDLDFSPDGRTLATVGSDAMLRLWERKRDGAIDAARRPLTLRGGGGALWWVRFRADGRLLATAGQDRTVRVWDLERTRATLAQDPRALRARAERETGLRVAGDRVIAADAAGGEGT